MGDTFTPNWDISRKQIADFAKDPRTIRDIESLSYTLSTQVPSLLGTKVDETRLIIAGAGLTGGGDLSGDITFDVGQGTGMIINADDIAIDLVAEAERIRDVIGTALTDTATIDFTADDGADTIKADLKNTAVTPGSYTSANITVDAQGRITAAASGSIAAGSIGPTELASTAVTPGSYTNTDLTVDADGRITAASNGSAGGGGSYHYEKFGALPLASTFTGVSAANLSLVDGNNNMRAVWTASGVNNVQLYKKTAPSTPYDVCMRLRPVITGANVQVGIVLRNSSSGKFLLLAIQSVNTITAQEWTSVSSFSSAVASQAVPHVFNGTAPGWLRVNNDGTTLTFYYSADGDLWISFGTRALSSFLSSCDEYGIGAVCQSASHAFIGSFGAALPT